MKSCLKCSSSASAAAPGIPGPSTCSGNPCRSPTSPRPLCQRQVSFRDSRDFEVHTADDWDRSPVEIAHNLSYEDILELKQMQVEAARAQARQHGTSSRYLPKVPLAVVPLLPSTGPSYSPKLKSSSGNPSGGPRIPTASAVGLALSEACLCRVLSADTGTHRSPQCALHASSRKMMATPPPSRDGRTQMQQNQNQNQSQSHTIPSPPHTPPRQAFASLAPPLPLQLPVLSQPSAPPPPRKLKNFEFVPLLGGSSSGSDSGSAAGNGKKEADTKHGLITPPLSAQPSWTQLAPTYAAQNSQPPAQFRPQNIVGSSSSNGYNPDFSIVGDRAATSLGLERKLGFSFGASPHSSSESDSEDEERKEGGVGGEDEDEDEQDWRLKELRARELKQRKERMSPPPRRRAFTRLV